MTCQIQINRLPDMPNKKNSRSTRRPVAGTHAKSLFLPMPRHEASDLALRARIVLERLRNGEADRSLVNLVSQVAIITSFITRAGHGQLDVAEVECVERGLGEVLSEADRTGAWHVPESLIAGLTTVINEYDRQLCMTRMEIVVRASDHLGKLVDLAARDTRTNDSELRVAR
ncbi:hypothetical protein M3I53_35950 [Paraburkholderia sp. CNPSo 3272]|uniref:hypothetical protein n=1 Tax=Paraburkholderia sp. CNPSo 3272 TaxID=2940931 RepID=UPI0020B6FA76|nr:hypothetical protein [Paraburkholderia sp. CNPSo 3272]MCP3728442.1 hypothetical protein [Paraburkholderia sp. CNPSo 3272]